MEAGQLEIYDPVILGGRVWWVASKGEHGDVSLTRDDGGGCITVCHLGEHEEVEHAGRRLADLRGELDAEVARFRRSSRGPMREEVSARRIQRLRAEMDSIEAQNVKAQVIL